VRLKVKLYKNMPEVYTSSGVCNEQINLIDNTWLEKENLFNKIVANVA